jgi:hypothetical protein
MNKDDIEAWLDEHDPTHLGDRLANMEIAFARLAMHPDPVVSREATKYFNRTQKLIQEIINANTENDPQGSMDSG